MARQAQVHPRDCTVCRGAVPPGLTTPVMAAVNGPAGMALRRFR